MIKCVPTLQFGGENSGHVQVVFGTVVVAIALRLRHESGEVGADVHRELENQISRPGRVANRAESHIRRQHAEVLVRGLSCARH